MAKTRIIAEPGVPLIEVTREFDAPREFIYRALTEPKLLVQWLGPRRLTMTVDDLDLRHGGSWRFINREDNGTEYAFRGVFHGTPSLEGITRTFEFEGAPGHVSLETATFEEQNGKTLLRMRSAFQTVEDRDGMIQSGMESGVNESMDRLDELIAKSLTARR